MEAFKARFQAWELPAATDGTLRDWWVQDPATGKPDAPHPHHFLLWAVNCHIDGNTLCYKQGVTDDWLPISAVGKLREAVSSLEAKFAEDSEMQRIVREAIPKRPSVPEIPFDHQFTNDNAELLLYDVVDECWRAAEDYEALLTAEKEKLALERKLEDPDALRIRPGDVAVGTSVLDELDAGTSSAAVASAAVASNANTGTSSNANERTFLEDVSMSPKAGGPCAQGRGQPERQGQPLLVGNGSASSSSSKPIPSSSSATAAADGVSEQQENQNQSQEPAALSKNALKRKRWREKKKLEKQAGVFHSAKEISDVYISALPGGISLEELKELFGKCGSILEDPATKEPSIKVYKKEGSGEARGDALVRFVRKESVEQAIARYDEQEVVAAASGEKSVIHVQRAEYRKEFLTTAELKERVAQKDTDWKSGENKPRAAGAKQKQLQKLRMEEDEGKRTLRLRSQIVLRNVFDDEGIRKSGRSEKSFIDELREDLLEDYLDWNPKARAVIEQHNQLVAKNNILPGVGGGGKGGGKGPKAHKPPVRIMAFVGAGGRGFVTVQFDDVDEAEMYRSRYDGRKFDGRTVTADFHDGADLKKGTPAATGGRVVGGKTSGRGPEAPSSGGGKRANGGGGAAEDVEMQDVEGLNIRESSDDIKGRLGGDEDEELPSAKRRRVEEEEVGPDAASLLLPGSGEAAGAGIAGDVGEGVFQHVETNDDWLFDDDDDDDEDDD